MNAFSKQGRPALIGVIHLPPLPGSPSSEHRLDALVQRALDDARTLRDGGAKGLIVENLGDAPFHKDRVDPWTVAAMTRIAWAIRGEAPNLTLGINVLRNDALSALGIAATVDADFIRVNIHTGVMATDQGIIEGRARQTLLTRRQLGASVAIAADVMVKHAQPLGAIGPEALAQAARDTAHRGQADALIVSGSGTGEATSPETLNQVVAATPTVPVWVGSGVRLDNVATYADADALIVGTWLHEDAALTRPLCPKRLAQFQAALMQLPD